MKRKPKYPRGCSEAQIRAVVAHYEGQTEDEEFAQIEAARKTNALARQQQPHKDLTQRRKGAKKTK